MTPKISLRNIWSSYGQTTVLQGLNLDIPAGQVVSVIGPSGSGKSTLLRLLMTLESPDKGEVLIDGQPLFGVSRPTQHALSLRMGMVFQHFNLFPHLCVLSNITEAPRRVKKVPKDQAEREGIALLERVGLGDKHDAYPGQLSGGQKQRVAIARALAMKPDIMLFDEITSALDPELVGGILDLVAGLSKEHDMTMLIVTHEMRFARESSERILFFDEGNIVEDAAPECMFCAPQEVRTQSFLSSIQ